MLAAAAAAAVAVPPAASCYSPLKPVRRWGISWRRRAARVEAGYSQLELRKVTYRPPGTEHNLLNEINLSSREKFWLDIWTEWEWKDHPLTAFGWSIRTYLWVYLHSEV
ncbi:unnamed protein product [Urochloa humidicola]